MECAIALLESNFDALEIGGSKIGASFVVARVYDCRYIWYDYSAFDYYFQSTAAYEKID